VPRPSGGAGIHKQISDPVQRASPDVISAGGDAGIMDEERKTVANRVRPGRWAWCENGVAPLSCPGQGGSDAESHGGPGIRHYVKRHRLSCTTGACARSTMSWSSMIAGVATTGCVARTSTRYDSPRRRNAPWPHSFGRSEARVTRSADAAASSCVRSGEPGATVLEKSTHADWSKLCVRSVAPVIASAVRELIGDRRTAPASAL
jgi:hypothetical protein